MKVPIVYILCLNNKQYHIGSTDNLDRRIDEHHTGRCLCTKSKLPVKLIFAQDLPTLKDARRVEYWIKKQKSRRFIEKLIENKINLNNILGGP